MIKLERGDILKADAEALVNTVNCVGVMGKGIALQFRNKYPENYTAYKLACDHKELTPGRVFIFDRGALYPGVRPRYIVNFPTKNHWRGKSKMEFVTSGLDALVSEVRDRGIRSIAIPPLGCGNGGLEWDEVRPAIEQAFSNLEGVDVHLYEPAGAPKADAMEVRTDRPKMTQGRAAVIRALHLYQSPTYRHGLLEVQKLAYFVQGAGWPLRLNYARNKYGPYAENLHHVLQRIEGHFTRGYGDRSQDTEIYLLPGAVEEANDFLRQDPEAERRLERVKRLIDGFETPYGMELLSTVHWLGLESEEVRRDPEAAVEGVRAWNGRKAKLFRPSHVRIAWERLRDEGWFEEAESPVLL